MRDPNPSTADLALAAERAAAESDYETRGGDAGAAGDAAPGDGLDADAAGAARPDLDDAARVDPHPRAVPGADDAGAQGRDRDHGGWGDRGLSGGRAGGTGL